MPTRIGIHSKKFRNNIFKEAAAGFQHSLVLSENGSIYSWGNTKNGILGVGEFTNKIIYLPKKIQNFKGFIYEELTCNNLSNINFSEIYTLNFSKFYKNSKNSSIMSFFINKVVCSENNTFFLTSEGLFKFFLIWKNIYF